MVVLAKLRDHRRVSVDISNEAGTQRLCDVSLGGMRVQSARALRMGESIEINLATGKGPLRLKGRVVRARLSGVEGMPYEYGFVFETLSEEDQGRLRTFMMKRGVGETPVGDVDGATLKSLEDRIAELELELAEAEASASTTRSALARDRLGEGGDRPRETHFDKGRFGRLLSLGQPMTRLVDDPGGRLEGVYLQSVAEAFTETFDLVSIKTRIEGHSGHDAVIDALFTFYENDLIDFA